MDEISAENLQGLRLLKSFNKALDQVLSRQGEDGERSKSMQRNADYLSLYLFGLLNPAIRSMRALCELNGKEHLCEQVGITPFKRSTFSETQHLIDPVLLEQVFRNLAAELSNRQPGGDKKVSWRIVDSSIFNVLPRLEWAYFKMHEGKPQSALRLHVSLDLVSSAPVQAEITRAKVGERTLWRKTWKSGSGEVGDRNFSQDYGLLRLLERKGGWFLLRLREKQARVNVEEELALSDKDRKEGIVRQAWGTLGASGPRVRVIWIDTGKGEPLMLATNQTPEQMTAEMASQMYRNRWQIELFFRWVKCILRCRHFLAESERGVAIQLYLALIAAVLLQMHLGRRPSLRMWEALQFFFFGLFTEEDLSVAIEREKSRIAAKTAKKS